MGDALKTAIASASAPNSTQNLIGQLVGKVVDLVGTAPSAVGLVSDALCPTTTALANKTSPVPGIGTLTGGLNTLICDLALIDFTFRTTVNSGTGPIVHNMHTLLDVPVPLLVGNNPVPALIGTVTAISTSKVTLTINKLPGAPKTLPVQTELITRDPSNVQSSNRLSVGYDGRPSTAPDKFKTTLGILSTSAPVHLTVTIDQSGAGDGAALVAGETATGSSKTAHVAFTPFPATIGADLTLGASQDIKLTTSVASTAVAHVDLVDGSSEQVIDGTIDQLPTSAEVEISSAGASQRQIVYGANAPINTLKVTYRSLTNSASSSHLDQEADATVTGVPTGLTFTQTGAASASLTTTGGSIGQIDGGFAENGAPVPVAGTGSGAHVVLQSPLTSVAVRISGVSAVTVDASKPYTADIQSTSQPMDILVEDHDGGRTIDAQIHNLPAHLAITVDPDAGKVVSNGFGEAISEIKVQATSTSPWFARATRIVGDITGIPSEMTLTYGTASDGTFSVGSDNPIGEINLLASDGSDQALPDSNSGVMYTDVTGGKFAITARVAGLQSISANPSPLGVAERTNAPQVFEIHAHKDQIVADGTIEKLPSSLCFQQVPASGSTPDEFVYSANAPIDHIHLAASGLPLPGSATALLADILSLPKSIVITMPGGSGPVFTAAATNGNGNPDGSANCSTAQNGTPTGIGNLMVEMADSTNHFVQFRKQAGDYPFPPADPNADYSPTADGFTMRDLETSFVHNYAIGIQVHGLRSASVQTSPLDVKADVDPALAKPFGVSIQSQHADDGNDFTYYEGWLSKLVPNMDFGIPTPASLGVPDINPTLFHYSAGGVIPTLDFRSNLGGVKYLRAVVTNVPRNLDLCFGAGKDGEACWAEGYLNFPPFGTPIVAVGLNDHGTGAADGIDTSVNAVICLDRNHPDQCPGTEPTNSDQSHDFAVIDDLHLHELEFAIRAEVCDGLLFCGAAFANTSNQDVHGSIRYYKYHLTKIGALFYDLHAAIDLPPGFHALNRSTRWNDHPVTPPFYPSDHRGTITCPDGTGIHAHLTDNVSGADIFPNDISGVLCKDGLFG
jgi:hypothetical protein